MKSKRFLWIAALLVAALAASLWGMSMRRSPKPAPITSTQKLELAPSDVTAATQRTLTVGLPISGGLKAYSSAVLKAKASGEIRGLKVREGEAVQAGELLATIDATEYAARLSQAQKNAEASKAQVDIAQRAYANNKALVEQNFISPTALQTSTATLDGAQASYQAALAAVEVARKALSDTRVIAPISGVVSQRLTQNGERVGPDTRIVEIVDLRRLELEAALSAADSTAVRIGQKAALRIEAGQSVQASVVRINPSTTAGSRAVLVYLQLASSAGLRQGLFAQGILQTQQVSGVTVPADSVRFDKPAPYVQLVVGGRIVHAAVQVEQRGESEGLSFALVSGVEVGALVLKGSVGQVREGTTVTQAAQASPAAKK